MDSSSTCYLSTLKRNSSSSIMHGLQRRRRFVIIVVVILLVVVLVVEEVVVVLVHCVDNLCTQILLKVLFSVKEQGIIIFYITEVSEKLFLILMQNKSCKVQENRCKSGGSGSGCGCSTSSCGNIKGSALYKYFLILSDFYRSNRFPWLQMEQ